MSQIDTIEHVTLEKQGKSADVFIAFWSDGTSRVSEWIGATWNDTQLDTHEAGIELAASYVRRGYRCTSLLTGDVA